MGLNPADSINKYVNTAFDDIKKVADNIDTVVNAGEIVDTHQVAAADPILRADGSALQTGDTYWHTVNNIRYTYTVGLTWVAESTHDAALVSEVAAAASEAAALVSETNAGTSNTNAGIAQTAAETAQTAAELAETNAAISAATIVNGVGADVASATALPLISDGDQFTVTGVATITSMNTLGAGKVVFLTFAAALTLTHHATDLVLPGAVNIVTASGDVGIFQEYATGDWRCLNYLLAVDPVVDDYQEGTYTATLTPAISGTMPLFGTADLLSYTKNNRVVYISGHIVVDTPVSPLGTIQLNLPFAYIDTAEGSDIIRTPVYCRQLNTVADGFTIVAANVLGGQSTLNLMSMTYGLMTTEIVNGTILAFNFFYFTSA